ncbi:hypothetical protein [Ekhidna sp.]|uniref:hypothetical protein n=1 Tax=Ekhidna sp. TaxID=2608089 RepID=UPI003B512348
MKKLSSLIYFTLILFTSQLYSQSDTITFRGNNIDVNIFKKNYNKNALYQQGLRYYRGNEKLSNKEFIRLLNSNEESKIELDKYIKYKKTENILSGIGIAAIITSWIILDENEGVAKGIGYSGVTLIGMSAIFSRKGKNHLNKVILNYNRDVAINPN